MVNNECRSRYPLQPYQSIHGYERRINGIRLNLGQVQPTKPRSRKTFLGRGICPNATVLTIQKGGANPYYKWPLGAGSWPDSAQSLNDAQMPMPCRRSDRLKPVKVCLLPESVLGRPEGSHSTGSGRSKPGLLMSRDIAGPQYICA